MTSVKVNWLGVLTPNLKNLPSIEPTCLLLLPSDCAYINNLTVPDPVYLKARGMFAVSSPLSSLDSAILPCMFSNSGVICMTPSSFSVKAVVSVPPLVTVVFISKELPAPCVPSPNKNLILFT